jgi:hypothetical protein
VMRASRTMPVARGRTRPVGHVGAKGTVPVMFLPVAR